MTMTGALAHSAVGKLLRATAQMFTPPEAFADAQREAQFREDYGRSFAMQRRAVIFLGALSWLLYLVWDKLHADHSPAVQAVLPELLAWRIAGFLLLGFIGILAMGDWFERSESAATRLLVGGNLGLAIVAYWMMLLVPLEYAFRFYYFGLLISMVFAFGVLRLRAIVIVWLMVCYAVAGTALLHLMVWLSPQSGDPETVAAAWKLGTMLGSIAVIGAAFGIQLERSQRASFAREVELAEHGQLAMAHSREVEALNAAILRNSEVAEDRHRALVDLKEQMRVQAEARNREKSIFLANAVHDLKQPLQAIGNALEPALRLMHKGEGERLDAMIRLAQRATGRMRLLMSEILEMSRLESGHVEAKIANVDIRAVVDEVLAHTASEAFKHGVRLGIDEDPALTEAPLVAKTDAHFVTRILLNLVGNGIRYRDDQRVTPSVRLQLGLSGEEIWVDVVDNGIGIDAELLDRGDVFKPFFQVQQSGRRDDAGAGLGLSIVAAMLALLPAHRLLPSSVLGQGTRMRLVLPRAADDAVVTAQRTPWPAGSVIEPSLYVLVIEDDELVRRSTCELLSQHGVLNQGYDSATSLSADIAHIERAPDVVLTDWLLPRDQSPLEALALLEPRFGRIPCVVFTGERVDADELLRFPIARVLFKPVDARVLLEAIVSVSRPAAEVTSNTPVGPS